MEKITLRVSGSLCNMASKTTPTTKEFILHHTSLTKSPQNDKPLGLSNFHIQIPIALWKANEVIAEKENLILLGEPKASLTQNNVPFIQVAVYSIEKEERQQPLQKEPAIERKIFKPAKRKEAYDVTVRWNEREEITQHFVQLPISSIILTEKEHTKTKLPSRFINKETIKPLSVIVRPLDDETFSLTTGLLHYIIAKLYDLPIRAFIFDGTKQELIETYNVQL